MPLMRHPDLGTLLRADSGLLAYDPACCCDECTCSWLPSSIWMYVDFCGQVEIELVEIVDTNDWLLQCQGVQRAWRGLGSFGTNGSTALFELACDGNTLYFRSDYCTTTFPEDCPDSWSQSAFTLVCLGTLLFSLTGVPISACDPDCLFGWTIDAYTERL